MVSHARSARRKDRQVGATLLLQLQLAVDNAGADLVVTDCRARRRGPAVFVRRDLLLPPGFVLARRRRVVAMAIDDHLPYPNYLAIYPWHLSLASYATRFPASLRRKKRPRLDVPLARALRSREPPACTGTANGTAHSAIPESARHRRYRT